MAVQRWYSAPSFVALPRYATAGAGSLPRSRSAARMRGVDQMASAVTAAAARILAARFIAVSVPDRMRVHLTPDVAADGRGRGAAQSKVRTE